MPASRSRSIASSRKGAPNDKSRAIQPTGGAPYAKTAPTRAGKAKKPAPPRIISTDADVCEGIRALRRKCPVIRLMHDRAGDPPLRRREPGFEGLARIIVGQQVSVASANAIWERTFRVVQPFEPAILLATSDEALRQAGLSRGKIKTLSAIARELSATGLNLDALDALTDDEIHAALTRISGIGPWTADVFIMFCLGRADAFAGGDLALQVAAQLAMDLDARPSAQELVEIAERWRPWRAVAARMLWAYYKVAKEQKSGMPV